MSWTVLHITGLLYCFVSVSVQRLDKYAEFGVSGLGY